MSLAGEATHWFYTDFPYLQYLPGPSPPCEVIELNPEVKYLKEAALGHCVTIIYAIKHYPILLMH